MKLFVFFSGTSFYFIGPTFHYAMIKDIIKKKKKRHINSNFEFRFTRIQNLLCLESE